MSKKGLLILRRNLDAFIKADPVMITFSRPVQVSTPAGGWKPGVPVTIPAQQLRFVPFKRRMSNDVQNTQDGPLQQGNYILVGRYNTDVKKGDEFSYNSLDYKVIQIEPKSDDRSQTDRVTIALEVRE